MIRPTAGFIVYGVHKDGLQDPMGQPFIDDQLVARSKKALADQGIDLGSLGGQYLRLDWTEPTP
ncbi:MAG: hypothetical protein HUU20_10710, partial [Pirellulales bacterium]|nr:hypothetical protein [Pirellulales bacterium]